VAYENGLLVDPNNEQLKASLDEVRAQKSGSNFMNPFNSPDIFVKLRNDPRTKAYLDDPEYLKLLNDLRCNPKLIGK
jgi:stress-induced-phosphoprotein 1